MATIRESAQGYEPPQTRNISELKSVNTEMDIQHKVVGEGESAFEYDYIVKDGEEYRVPKSVLKQLKTQLEENPEATEFKVKKTGEGMKTEYTVILL